MERDSEHQFERQSESGTETCRRCGRGRERDHQLKSGLQHIEWKWEVLGTETETGPDVTLCSGVQGQPYVD